MRGLLRADFSIRPKSVFDEQTSHSTQPASWQVAGYSVKAGIQLIKNSCKAGQTNKHSQ